MNTARKTYTVSVGLLKVCNVEISASSPDEALATAQQDWNHGRTLDCYECPDHDAECNFQIEDVEEEGRSHDAF